jgi:hypothetical protein
MAGDIHTNMIEGFWLLLKRVSQASTTPSQRSTCRSYLEEYAYG